MWRAYIFDVLTVNCYGRFKDHGALSQCRRRQLLAVDVQTVPALRIGTPPVLFEGRFVDRSSGFYTDYDIDASGEQFLMIKPDDETALRRLNVVVGALK